MISRAFANIISKDNPSGTYNTGNKGIAFASIRFHILPCVKIKSHLQYHDPLLYYTITIQVNSALWQMVLSSIW